MKRIRHIFSWLAAVITMTALTSCALDKHWDFYEPSDSEAETGTALKEGWITITLHTIGDYDNLPDIEKIQNYKILIVDPDAERIDAVGSGNVSISKSAENLILRYPVKFNPAGKKKVYAIANYEMTCIDLTEWKIGGIAETAVQAVENCVFSIDTGNGNIPFFGSCEVDFDEEKADNVYNADLYLVRVATKFEFTIKNLRDKDITVKSLSISNLSDSQYLAPHLAEDCGVINENEKGEFRFGPLLNPFNSDVISWDAWLAKAVEESQSDANDEDLADKRGWIMEYYSPTAELTEKSLAIDKDNNEVDMSGGILTLPAYYLNESRGEILSESKPSSGTDNCDRRGQNYVNSKGAVKNARTLICNDAAGRQRYYYFTIKFKDSDEDTKTFHLDFYNLRALFRNTDVRVDITVSGSGEAPPDIDWTIHTRPWTLRIQPEIVL